MTSGLDDGGPAGVADQVGPFGLPSARSHSRVEHAHRLASVPGGLPALDRLARLAAQLVGAGSAQVSILAEEQTVMGGFGEAAQSVGKRSAIADSLCSVTLDAAEPLLIPDAADDERVRDLPPVTSGAVRSYLGVPLRVHGHLVGALCVFDPHVHAWEPADVALLEQLSEPVVAELELAALRASYEDDRRTWRLAVDAAGVGAFDWELTTDHLRWDERLLELFGLDRDTFGGSIEAFNEAVHPHDRERVRQALSEAIATCGEYAAEYRINRPDGDIRWVAARGLALSGPDGVAARLVGAAYDTTAVREGEARVARMLDAMPTAFYQLDNEWRFTYANPEAQRLLGGIGTDIVGHLLWDLFPYTVGSDFETHYRQAVETGRPVSFEAYYPPPLDGWYELRCWPTPDGLSVYFIEVTERHRAREALDAAARRSALLADVAQTLVDTLEGEEAATRLAQLLVPGLGDWCLVTMVDGVLPDDPSDHPSWRSRLRDLGTWHVDTEARALVADYAAARIPSLTDDSLVTRALRTGRPVVVREEAAERIAAVLVPGAAQDLVRVLAPWSSVILPMRGRGRVAGLMSVFRGADRPAWDDDELDLLAEIASRAGFALDNVHLYDRQRDLAEGLQRSLLTLPPDHAGVEIAVRYEPAADAAQVGGDWYDAFSHPDGDLHLVIGDVVGHDTVAAAAMGQLRGLLRGIAVTTGAGPAEVLDKLDDAMGYLGIDTLASAVVARLETSDGRARLRVANAGHLPPLLLTPAGAASYVTDPEAHVMLGLSQRAGHQPPRGEVMVDLGPGDTLLLFTDGLVERRRESLDDGLERLRVAVAEPDSSGLGVEELADRVLSRLAVDWNEDDIALVVVRVVGA
ncbi:SpoIIE family protein phosphatase [Nocardioides plantarum]|uniref:SpoIIE family protein phosphatase n=1 Tax=Nocardioides plantarum TaxID=29299 RepID=A0ABV5KFT4_9ACTN|nr:SpoIIE family protein phosphatase [Nocardioides plantarum]